MWYDTATLIVRIVRWLVVWPELNEGEQNMKNNVNINGKQMEHSLADLMRCTSALQQHNEDAANNEPRNRNCDGGVAIK